MIRNIGRRSLVSCSRLIRGTQFGLSSVSARSGPWRQPQFLTVRFNSYINTQGESVEDKIDHLSINEYNGISNDYLDTLADELEELSESYPQIDSELTQGVLTISLPPNGTYVINKQPPNKQIWLSSPISGPKRYDSIEGKWVTLRDGSSLTQLLEEEISTALDTEFKFERTQA
ncbi:uncharacterized protein RJT21DRAFT_46768 [Scheffersomyces amazonensis]|uniref:uncharacterized protein n=1 Tax=Scheffersomyces amazonensis TaxID=1078765 RepID=UPI00315D70F1